MKVKLLWVLALMLAMAAAAGCEKGPEEPTEEDLAAIAERDAREATDGYFATLEATLTAAGLETVSFLGVTDNSLDTPDLNVERQYGNEVLARMSGFGGVRLFRQNSDIIKGLLSERGLNKVSDIGQEDIAQISEQVTSDCLVYGSVEDIDKRTLVLFAARSADGQIVWGATLETVYFSAFEPGEDAAAASDSTDFGAGDTSAEAEGGCASEDYNPWAIN